MHETPRDSTLRQYGTVLRIKSEKLMVYDTGQSNWALWLGSKICHESCGERFIKIENSTRQIGASAAHRGLARISIKMSVLLMCVSYMLYTMMIAVMYCA